MDMDAQPAILEMTLEVKRAATGKTEVFHLVGTPIQTKQEAPHERDTSSSIQEHSSGPR